MMKKLYKIVSLLIGCCMLLACFSSCFLFPTTTANADELSYISMRINPEIELVVDKEGEVVAVNAINEDGETVLAELDLIGMTAEEAGEAFTAAATELGFIDVDTEEATVYVLAEGKNEEFVKNLEEKLTEKIHGFFDKKGIFGKVAPEDLTEYEALAAEWEVSLKDAKMISRILELYPEMTVEEILELPFAERIKLIKEDSKKNGMPVQIRDEFREKVEALKEEYTKLFELGKELKDLAFKLKNKELTEEEVALLQTEYDAKKAEFDTLKAEYEAAVKALKEESCEKIEEVKNEIVEEAHKRRDEHAGKLQERDERSPKEQEDRKEQIKQWRDNHR